MPETFGARLRRQRERQQIALADIAKQTKIHLPLLEELEHDRVSHWPSGIFRRAFIRAYANAISLEPDDVVREFLTLYPDPVEVVTIGAALAPRLAASERPPTRIRYVASEVIARVAALWRKLFGHDGTESSTSAPAMTTAAAPARVDVDLLAAANICAMLAKAPGGDAGPSNLAGPLREALTVLGAVGLIVWVWDSVADELSPAWSQGYSKSVLSQLPRVRRDADNATAAAFRSERTCTVRGKGQATSALAVPIVTVDGCAGVLAVELPQSDEHAVTTRAVVTMMAAQLGRLLPTPSRRHARSGHRPPSTATASASGRRLQR